MTLVTRSEEKTTEFNVDEDALRGRVAIRKREVEERKLERAEQVKAKSKRRMKKGGGTTNEDKVRNKDFKMAQHSKRAASKKRRSLNKQVSVDKKHKKRMQLGHRRKYQRKR